MGLRRGFKAEANRIALRIREKMGLLPTSPIDPFAICHEYELQVIPLSSYGKASPFLKDGRSVFSAVTVPCGLVTAIVHNDSHSPVRQRSNICHELGHCFLGHDHVPPLTESGERARDGGIEAEANFLGGCLLITNEAAIHIVTNGLVNEATKIYGVSRDMLTYRLRVSGAETIHNRRIDKGNKAFSSVLG